MRNKKNKRKNSQYETKNTYMIFKILNEQELLVYMLFMKVKI